VSTNTLFINLVFSFGSTFNQLMLCTVAWKIKTDWRIQ
jgi:hypothetical protein